MNKNLLFVAFYSSKGGGEIYLENLIDYFNNKLNIIIVTNILKNKKQLLFKNKVLLYEREYTKPLNYKMFFKNIKFMIFLYKIIKRQKVDLIQVNDNYSLFYAFIPSKLLKIPIIFVNHSQYPPKYSIYKYIYKKIRLIICVSNWNKENLKKYCKYLKNLIIIPIGFMIRKQSNVYREYLTYCARYARIKRIDDFVKIVQMLKNEKYGNEIKYQIIGGSKNDPDYEEIVKIIPNYIEKIPFTNNIDYYYNRTKIYLNTSERESFGMTIIEAMMNGIPVISTNLPTIREFIEHERNGFLFEIGDTVSAIKYLIRLLDDENLYNEMSENNIKKSAKYSIGEIGEKYLEIYEKI